MIHFVIITTKGKGEKMRRVGLGKRNRGKKMKKLTHEFIDTAVNEYLKSGGKITVLDPADRDIQQVLNIKDITPIADDFLLDN